jgi:hypothetical protein
MPYFGFKFLNQNWRLGGGVGIPFLLAFFIYRGDNKMMMD